MNGSQMVESAVEAINRGDAAGYAAWYTDDAVTHDPLVPAPIKGRDAIEEDIAQFLRAFPDLHGTVESVLEDGDRVATEVAFTGTNTGPLETPDGTLPATGQPARFWLCSVVEMGPDGLATATRRYYDVFDLLTQLGLTS
jgi:steroid delta-isomerase-like uncharacterized protein